MEPSAYGYRPERRAASPCAPGPGFQAEVRPLSNGLGEVPWHPKLKTFLQGNVITCCPAPKVWMSPFLLCLDKPSRHFSPASSSTALYRKKYPFDRFSRKPRQPPSSRGSQDRLGGPETPWRGSNRSPMASFGHGSARRTPSAFSFSLSPPLRPPFSSAVAPPHAKTPPATGTPLTNAPTPAAP